MGESLLGLTPDDWRHLTLGEACALGGGDVQTGPFGSQLHASDYVADGIPSIMPVNIGDNRVVADGIARIPTADAERLARYRVRQGDIVYSRRGDVERRALITDEQDGWLCGTGCLRIRFGDGPTDPGYASYYLGHPEVRAWIVRHAHGATMPNLNTSILSSLPFVLPPMAEQRRIAGILGSIDDKMEVNRRISETLEAMARALFRSWFVDFDPVRAKAEGRDPGLPGPVGDLFPDSFVDSELGLIPKGWSVTSLDALFPADAECVLTGPFGSNLHAHDYRSNGVPLVLVKHVVDGRIIDDGMPRVGEHKAPELERYRLRLGDIVFSRVGAVGRTAFVHEPYVGWLISGQLLRVRIPDWRLLHPRYLSQLYLEERFTDMVESHALGTTRPSLNTGLVRSFRFVTPSGVVTELFAREVEALDMRRLLLVDETRSLSSARDALLPRLLAGDLKSLP